MRFQPDGAALLDIACTVLREEILAVVPEQNRLSVLMIANAMRIAGRQLKSGDGPAYVEMETLRDLLSQPVVERVMPTALEEQLNSLNKELSAIIRRGDADPGTIMGSQVYSCLRQSARQAVIESNPKYLE